MFDRIRKHRISARLATSLALLLIVQLLIPLQAHSRIDRDTQGLTVLICTLDGFRQARIATGEPEAERGRYSAAMAFSDLVHDLSPVLSATLSPFGVLAWETILPAEAVTCGFRTHPLPSSRDPPPRTS